MGADSLPRHGHFNEAGIEARDGAAPTVHVGKKAVFGCDDNAVSYLDGTHLAAQEQEVSVFELQRLWLKVELYRAGLRFFVRCLDNPGLVDVFQVRIDNFHEVVDLHLMYFQVEVFPPTP